MNILWFKDCSYKNKNLVGGKNASLGELYKISQNTNINISNGFAITVNMYNNFIKSNNLDNIIESKLNELDCDNIDELNKTSEYLINLINQHKFTDMDEYEILENYIELNQGNIEVAVRSSAICEDLPNASFAGQQNTYLNITNHEELLKKIINCYASLFNACAISYRHSNNIHYSQVKISVGIQQMIRSDLGSAGVAFSIDCDTGYNKAIVINSSYGLGEIVVGGHVKPDEFILHKENIYTNKNPIILKKKGNKSHKYIYNFDNSHNNSIIKVENKDNTYSLSDENIKNLGEYIYDLEQIYSELFNKIIAVDVEWAYDGDKIYILQTRPETVFSNMKDTFNNYQLLEKSKVIVNGVGVGQLISNGKIKILNSPDEHYKFNKGDILVTTITTPDWEPIMKKSAGIITNTGGRTCHAAIVARELNVPAIVGCSNATQLLKNNDSVTMDCNDGYVYEGELKYIIEEIKIDTNKNLPIKIMLNVGSPENAFSASMYKNDGVGLARLEFIINNHIGIHPKALIDYDKEQFNCNSNIITKKIIDEGYITGRSFFINKLAEGVSQIASAFFPKNVIVRMSDFKSNEYKSMLCGDMYEPTEENPMIGWRGASRYYSPEYKNCFELECLAIRKVREEYGFNNVIVMLPFVRTPDECNKVINLMEDYGLKRGEHNLQIYLMCEIPSNVIEADNFSKYVDGVSIGGNDLLQLTLGVDRDGDMVTHLSDYNNISYRRMIKMAIDTYKKNNVKVGFCGQQPSDSIEFCQFLIDSGIDSISVTPDSIMNVYKNL